MTKARNSIAFRLISAVLAVELASSLLIGVLSLGYERHIHFGAFDTMLRGRADSVLGAVQDAEDVGDNVMLDQADLHLPAEDVYEVYDARGLLLGRSPNWMMESSGPPSQAADGFSRLTIGGRHYRMLLLHGSRIVDPDEPGGGKLRRVTVLYGAPTERVWRAIRGAVEFYAAGSILLLAVTGPLIAWLLHRGLLPLRQLAALASRVTVNDWQFSPPASARETPELAPLTHAMESVLQRLERAFVQQRVFVSDSAHELKTAVAVVKSSLQLLSLRPRTAAEYEAGLDRAITDTERLEDLVAKMLTLARLESGAASPVSAGSPPCADIVACLGQAAAQLETFAALRRVEVSIRTPRGKGTSESSWHVPLDTDDCTLLISNLLLNALQHSQPDSGIQLCVAAEAGPNPARVELSVKDHGEGIAPDVLPHVFDRFYRGDASRARSTGGAGLGLAIAKAIVESAGGSIRLVSEPGKGTTVIVNLPCVAGKPVQTASEAV
jgi:signal transduction histidine kinase